MGAAFFCIDIIDVRKNIFCVAVGIFHRYFHNGRIPYTFHIDRLCIDFIFIGIHIFNELNDPSFKMKGLTAPAPLIGQGDTDSFIQKRQFPQA